MKKELLNQMVESLKDISPVKPKFVLEEGKYTIKIIDASLVAQYDRLSYVAKIDVIGHKYAKISTIRFFLPTSNMGKEEYRSANAVIAKFKCCFNVYGKFSELEVKDTIGAIGDVWLERGENNNRLGKLIPNNHYNYDLDYMYCAGKITRQELHLRKNEHLLM